MQSAIAAANAPIPGYAQIRAYFANNPNRWIKASVIADYFGITRTIRRAHCSTRVSQFYIAHGKNEGMQRRLAGDPPNAYEYLRPAAQLSPVTVTKQGELSTGLSSQKLNLISPSSVPSAHALNIKPGRQFVTWLLAAELLKTSYRNRRIRRNHVETFKRLFRENRFVYNGSPIIVDKDGHLMQGHHRLTAQVEVQCTAEYMLLTDVDAQTFDTQDIGLLQSIGQKLQMHGEGSPDQLGSALRVFAILESSNERANFDFSAKIYVLDIEAYLYDNPDIRDYLHHNCAKALRVAFPPSLLSAFAYFVSRRRPQEAREFFTLAQTGEGLDRNHPVLALRAHALSVHQRGKYPIRKAFGLLCKTWNAFILNKPIRHLRFLDDEPLQRIL
jgi:hypothetical protein